MKKFIKVGDAYVAEDVVVWFGKRAIKEWEKLSFMDWIRGNERTYFTYYTILIITTEGDYNVGRYTTQESRDEELEKIGKQLIKEDK